MSSSSKMTTTDLQSILDKEISTFKKSDWIGELLLGDITMDDENEELATGTIDVCQYLPGGQKHNDIDLSITKLRFDASIYPPSKDEKAAFASSNPTYVKLRNELQRAAIQCGYSMVPKSGARFLCKCGRTYANGTNKQSTSRANTTASDGEDGENKDPQLLLRKKTWKYDSRNIRPKGPEPLRRNTSTSLPLKSDDICRFAIKLYHDNKGFYISPKYGNAVHSNHPSIEATNNCCSLKLLPENVKGELVKLSKAKLGAAHGRNFVFANESDIFLTKSQIRYAFRNADAASLGVALPDLKMGGDGLVQYFNSRDDISYCIWGGNNTRTKKRHATDATFQSNLLFNATYSDGKEEIVSLDTLCEDVVDFYQKEKSILLNPDTQKCMFIGCGWTSKEELRLFQLNPFVMKVDATCHTNNEKCNNLSLKKKQNEGSNDEG